MLLTGHQSALPYRFFTLLLFARAPPGGMLDSGGMTRRSRFSPPRRDFMR